jgi:hypothetical protein
MSHYYSGPDYGFPHGDARLDLTDLYAFPKPVGWRRSGSSSVKNKRTLSRLWTSTRHACPDCSQ